MQQLQVTNLMKATRSQSAFVCHFDSRIGNVDITSVTYERREAWIKRISDSMAFVIHAWGCECLSQIEMPEKHPYLVVDFRVVVSIGCCWDLDANFITVSLIRCCVGRRRRRSHGLDNLLSVMMMNRGWSRTKCCTVTCLLTSLSDSFLVFPTKFEVRHTQDWFWDCSVHRLRRIQF